MPNHARFMGDALREKEYGLVDLGPRFPSYRGEYSMGDDGLKVADSIEALDAAVDLLAALEWMQNVTFKSHFVVTRLMALRAQIGENPGATSREDLDELDGTISVFADLKSKLSDFLLSTVDAEIFDDT